MQFSDFFKDPKVMGIVNLTPDSFYDGNQYTTEKAILKRVETILKEGGEIIDLGAFSSRPGADFVSYKEERRRLINPLKSIVKHFPDSVLSIDTYRAAIARESVGEGATIINDISAGNLDPEMFATVAQMQVPYIMMHMKGTPKNMQSNTEYDDVVQDIIGFFQAKINRLKDLNFDQIIIDPGFGFGKTTQQNYQTLNKLHDFVKLNFPVLVGISRKSMLYKLLQITPAEALNATTVAHTIALLNGAKILRVHDVKEAVEAIKIVKAIQNN